MESGPMEWIKFFYKDESGMPAAEYCILLACIAVAILSAVGIFGSTVQGLFTNCRDKWP